MTNELISAAMGGFKDSFKLLAGIFVAIFSIVVAFVNHDKLFMGHTEAKHHIES